MTGVQTCALPILKPLQDVTGVINVLKNDTNKDISIYKITGDRKEEVTDVSMKDNQIKFKFKSEYDQPVTLMIKKNGYLDKEVQVTTKEQLEPITLQAIGNLTGDDHVINQEDFDEMKKLILNDNEKDVADMNNDGKVDVVDLAILEKVIEGQSVYH